MHFEPAPPDPPPPVIPSLKSAWIIDGMLVDYEVSSDPPVNKLTFAPFEGGHPFTYSLDDFVVEQVVSNRNNIFILMNRTMAGSQAGQGEYRVDRCGYDGRCVIDRNFDTSVFRIASFDKGYYAISFEPEDYYCVESRCIPKKSEIIKISEYGVERIETNPSMRVYAINYDRKSGLSIIGVDHSVPFAEREFTLYRTTESGSLSNVSSSINYLGCDFYIYRDFFYCVGEGGRGGSRDHQTTWTVSELVGGDLFGASRISLAFPFVSDSGSIFLRGENGNILEIPSR